MKLPEWTALKVSKDSKQVEQVSKVIELKHLPRFCQRFPKYQKQV